MKSLLAVLLLSTGLCAQTFTTFAVANSNGTWPRALNNSGEVVGGYEVGTTTYGFERDPNGKMHLLGTHRITRSINSSGEFTGRYSSAYAFYELPNQSLVKFCAVYAQGRCLQTIASSINDAGWITGNYVSNGGNTASSGYVISPTGVVTTFLVSDLGNAWPASINNSNQIVGSWQATPNAPTQGFLYSSGTVSTLDYPGASYTSPEAINDSGEVVGEWRDSNGMHGFYWTAATGFTSFDPLGAFATGVLGVNSLGVIAGNFQTSSTGPSQGFTLDATGKFTVIKVPHAASTYVSGINDNGAVLGCYPTANNVYRGFLYVP